MITPRPHQIAALKDIKKGFKKYDRAQAILACGTGKSLLAAWAAVQQNRAKKVVVLLPSLALIRQLLRTWRSVPLWKSWEAIAVCSDKTVGEDAVHVKASEVGCEVTTDPQVVAAFMKGKGVRVVFSTYQSAALLAGNKFDLGIFDEAHKTAGSKEKQFAFALSNKNLRIKKRLFLTATPRVWGGRDEDAEYASMDDEKVYGPRVHELSFRKAVELKLIRDYKIIVTGVLEDVDTDHYTALQVAVQKAMDDVGAKQVFSYHRSVAEAVQFSTDPQGIFGSDVSLFHVNGKQTTAERDVTLTAFAKAPRALVSNARCLSEGVDVPVTDMVVFAQAKRSVIDIVQSAGRAMRLSEGKEFGYIVIPVWYRKGEDYQAAAKRLGYNVILDVLNAMASQDASFEAAVEKMRVVSDEGGVAELPSNIEIFGMGNDLETLRRAVVTAIVTQKRGAGFWSFERCKEVALGFTDRGLLRTKEPKAYSAMLYNGWLEELTQHMARRERISREEVARRVRAIIAQHGEEVLRTQHRDLAHRAVAYKMLKPRKRMTYTECAAAVRGYRTRAEAEKKAPGAYSLIRKNGWDELLPAPTRVAIASRDTSRENLLFLSKGHRTASSFRKEYPWAYVAALDKGLIPELFPSTAAREWILAEVEVEAAKYSMRSDFKRRSPGAYKAARRFGVLDKLLPRLQREVWTLSTCLQEAARYPNASAMMRGSSGAYSAAADHGWLKKLRFKKAA